jgi:hypothetical protein
MVSVPARRRQVEYGRERGLSARRACTLFSVARSALDYHSRQAAKDAAVMVRMKELSAQYPRYGYRRIRIFLGRDGHAMSPGRAEGVNRKMAAALQRDSSTFEPGLSHAERVRGSSSKASAPSCNGPGRCGVWGLRAPARCSIAPPGTNAASRDSRLKLTVVRRNRAGQYPRRRGRCFGRGDGPCAGPGGN